MHHPNIRMADREDAETIFHFICELAEFENARHEVQTDATAIEHAVFGENSVCDALIYEESGEPVAFALWYYTFSTWQGRAGLYLEDLYVTPAARGKGVGSQILKYLAKLALEKRLWSI